MLTKDEGAPDIMWQRRGSRVTIDPWFRRIARLARVARSTDAASELLGHCSPKCVRLLFEHGAHASILHAVHAVAEPERAAIVDDHRTVTYARANTEINRFANAIVAHGAHRGDALVLALENRAEYVLAWFSAMRLGMRVLHAGAHVTAAELADMLKVGVGCAVIIGSDASIAAIHEVRATTERSAARVILCGNVTRSGDELAYEELVATGDDSFPRVSRPKGESVVFTSGTTGAPKGAVRDFAAFGPTELVRVLERLPFAFGDRHLVAGPLHHSAPQVFALLHTALAGTLYLSARFDAETTLRDLAERRIHSTFLVPTMLRRILDLPEKTLQAITTPDLRAVVVGSSEFNDELRREAIARFGARHVFDFYGATELGWITLIRGDEMLTRPGSVGRPLAGQELCVLDDHGNALPSGETGIIGVRNAQTMLGYARDPRATEESKCGSWWTVEDLGRLDRDGYLYLAGRARDMVKTGGVNVYPTEIERVLGEDPSVREVAVVGVPDREWGERVVAVVVPRGPFDAEKARARARSFLSAAKVPREWHVVEALPRNANGKILRNDLRARCVSGDFTDDAQPGARPVHTPNG